MFFKKLCNISVFLRVKPTQNVAINHKILGNTIAIKTNHTNHLNINSFR
jgi:hypothetical protein